MKPYILGLTGSIGMGKSTTAKMFADAGIPVFDSDATVHRLYEKGGAAVEPIRQRFPNAIIDDAVSRPHLSQELAKDRDGFKDLEAIVHPLVVSERKAFLDTAKEAGARLVVFDVPLLFETGGDQLVNGVLVVTAPAEVQRERVLARDGMTESTLMSILDRQTPDLIKREKADFLIDTSLGLESARKAVDELIAKLIGKTNQG